MAQKKKDLYEVDVNGEIYEVEAESPDEAARLGRQASGGLPAAADKGMEPQSHMDHPQYVPGKMDALVQGVEGFGERVADFGQGAMALPGVLMQGAEDVMADPMGSLRAAPAKGVEMVGDALTGLKDTAADAFSGDPRRMGSSVVDIALMSPAIKAAGSLMKRGVKATGRRAATASQESPLMAAATGESGMLARMRRYLEGMFTPEGADTRVRRDYVMNGTPDDAMPIVDRYAPNQPASGQGYGAPANPIPPATDRWMPNSSSDAPASRGGHVVGHDLDQGPLTDPSRMDLGSVGAGRVPYGNPEGAVISEGAVPASVDRYMPNVPSNTPAGAPRSTSRVPYGNPSGAHVPEVSPVTGRVNTAVRAASSREGDLERVIREALEEARRGPAPTGVSLPDTSGAPSVTMSERARAAGNRRTSTTSPSEKMVTLYRVEPNDLGDKGEWLKKSLTPEQFRKFTNERGRLFSDDLASLKNYGHGEPTHTTYQVQVPESVAKSIARQHPDGFTEYLVPKNAVTGKTKVPNPDKRTTAVKDAQKGADTLEEIDARVGTDVESLGTRGTAPKTEPKPKRGRAPRNITRTSATETLADTATEGMTTTKGKPPRPIRAGESDKVKAMFGGVSTGDPMRRFPRGPLSTKGMQVGVEYDPDGLSVLQRAMDAIMRKRR